MTAIDTMRWEQMVPRQIKSDFMVCSGLTGAKRRAAKSLLDILRAGGAEFYFVEPNAPLVMPEAEIESTGDLSLVGIAHPALRQGPLAVVLNSPWLGSRGNADLRFLAASQEPMLYQSSFVRDQGKTDDLAIAHRLFTLRLLPLLKPRLAWLDASGDSAPSARCAERVELRHLFWATFFGPPFVHKFGREFLLSAPAWRVDDLAENGVMLTATERYSDWLAAPLTPLLAYLATKTPGIKPYRYKPIP